MMLLSTPRKIFSSYHKGDCKQGTLSKVESAHSYWPFADFEFTFYLLAPEDRIPWSATLLSQTLRLLLINFKSSCPGAMSLL